MKNIIFKGFTICVLIISLFSCNNALDAPEEKGMLILCIKQSDSRTVLAPNFSLEDLSYTLKGKKSEAEEITIINDISYSNLTGGIEMFVDAGTWDFTLFANSNSNGRTCYKAELKNMDIVVGNNPLSFVLEEIPQNGTGGFRVSLKIPNDKTVETVKAGLFDVDANVIREYESLSIYENSVVYEENNIESGLYIVSFKFFKSDSMEIKPGYDELVQVKDSRVSIAERTIENLERLHSIDYNLKYGTFSGDSLPTTFYEYQRVILPTKDNISKAGYSFGGWYENEDCSGDAVTEIPSFTSKDMVFWAKWIPIQYKITYEGLDGAENPNPETYTIVDEIELVPVIPAQSGMAFVGWTLNGEMVASIPKGTYGDIVVTANIKLGVAIDVGNISELNTWLSSQSGEGPFDVFVTGNSFYSDTRGITSSLFTSKKINLDLSNTTGILTISEWAFNGFTNLVSVMLPKSVTAINDHAFNGCTNLVNMEIPDGVTAIGNEAFKECTSLVNVKIPDSVTRINNDVFNGCTNLVSVEIPENVKTIGDGAFSGCTSLTNMEIPDGVTAIGKEAFKECTSLESIKIGDSVTSLGDYAFYGCTSLLNVEIPDGVERIGASTFSKCENLVKVAIPESVNSIGESAFSGCGSLASVEIPESVIFMGNNAFSGCKSLESVVIPNSVREIRAGLFSNCENLKNVKISDAATSIGGFAFGNCPSLKSITIPYSVIEIGNHVFSNCTSFESLVFEDVEGWYGNSGDVYYGIDVSDPVANVQRLISFSGFLKTTPDTTYKVEHLQQNIENDGYTTVNVDTIDGASGFLTVVKANVYDGFKAGYFQNTQIASDGSTVVQIKYDRKIITLTLHFNNGAADEKISGKYGTVFEIPDNPVRNAYTFIGWYDNEDLSGDALTELPSDMLEDVALWAKWIPKSPLGVSVTLPPPQTDVPSIEYSIDGNKITIIAEGGHNKYAWFIDMESKQTGNSNTLELDKTDMTEGLYSVMVGIDDMYSSTILVEIKTDD